MRKVFLTAVLGLSVLMTMAQTRAGGSSSSKTPAGSAFALSDGSTVTKNGEALTTSSSDYNVVQVTNGTLTMTDCTVTKTGDYSSSYSGDDTSFYGTNSAVYASGSGATINMTGGSVTTEAKGANAVFATNGATINVSNKLMTVEYYKRGENSTGHLVLRTTKDRWTYTGDVDADTKNSLAVTVGANVTWNGAADADNNAKSAIVTIESGAVWNLTGNSYVSTLTNNGTVNKNGYALTVGSSSGSGTINETTGIESLKSATTIESSSIYTLDGCRADETTRGIVIRNGKKYVVK